MRVITLQKPWASLIAANIKKIETRSWPCFEYGDFHIHAGLSKIRSSEQRRQELLKLIPTAPHYGEIFIKTTLSECVLITEEYARQIEERSFVLLLWGFYSWALCLGFIEHRAD